jgi:hypothetical protein
MPDHPGWITLPASFFDQTISDADLQDQWTSGAEGAYRRLMEQLAAAALAAGEQPTAARWRVVADLYAAAEKARAFLDEAQANAARYRQAETPSLPAPTMRIISDKQDWSAEVTALLERVHADQRRRRPDGHKLIALKLGQRQSRVLRRLPTELGGMGAAARRDPEVPPVLYGMPCYEVDADDYYEPLYDDDVLPAVWGKVVAE